MALLPGGLFAAGVARFLDNEMRLFMMRIAGEGNNNVRKKRIKQ
jgi:hypothetical protein